MTFPRSCCTSEAACTHGNVHLDFRNKSSYTNPRITDITETTGATTVRILFVLHSACGTVIIAAVVLHGTALRYATGGPWRWEDRVTLLRVGCGVLVSLHREAIKHRPNFKVLMKQRRRPTTSAQRISECHFLMPPLVTPCTCPEFMAITEVLLLMIMAQVHSILFS